MIITELFPSVEQHNVITNQEHIDKLNINIEEFANNELDFKTTKQHFIHKKHLGRAQARIVKDYMFKYTLKDVIDSKVNRYCGVANINGSLKIIEPKCTIYDTFTISNKKLKELITIDYHLFLLTVINSDYTFDFVYTTTAKEILPCFHGSKTNERDMYIDLNHINGLASFDQLNNDGTLKW